jgi:hypothetical protein
LYQPHQTAHYHRLEEGYVTGITRLFEVLKGLQLNNLGSSSKPMNEVRGGMPALEPSVREMNVRIKKSHRKTPAWY